MSYRPFNPFAPPPRETARPKATVDKKGRPIDPRKEARRKVTSFLINPDIGGGIKDMRETHGMFLQLVCNLFLQTGLIDAAYPGVADRKKLRLISLLRYAYKNLEYTRDGMPRVLLFYSFIASIAAMVLAGILFALQLMHSMGGVVRR